MAEYAVKNHILLGPALTIDMVCYIIICAESERPNTGYVLMSMASKFLSLLKEQLKVLKKMLVPFDWTPS